LFPNEETLPNPRFDLTYGPIINTSNDNQSGTGLPPLCAWIWFIPNPTAQYGEGGTASIYFNDPTKSIANKNVLYIQFDPSYNNTLFGVSTARNSKIYFTDSSGAPLLVPVIGAPAEYNINL
jgi:hypothetical protein